MKRVTANDFDFTGAPLFRKTATIPVASVVFGKGGEKVVTLQSGAAGQFAETINIAQLGDAIVTRSAGDSYIPKKFSNNFEINPGNSNEYRSKNFGRAIFQEEDFVIMAPWGEDQTIAAGGVVFQSLVGDSPEVYGNQGHSFEADYAREAADGALLPLTLPLKTQLQWANDKGEIVHLSDIRARAVYAREMVTDEKKSAEVFSEIIRVADIAILLLK
ncbi:MAG: hypothetical protein WDN02_13565 [Methylovirgula sp.]|uniref:hypothetical protein n=1 Tax=Methylovirgula sp. TaxID=1978224 RepID=UPI0030767535